MTVTMSQTSQVIIARIISRVVTSDSLTAVHAPPAAPTTHATAAPSSHSASPALPRSAGSGQRRAPPDAAQSRRQPPAGQGRYASCRTRRPTRKERNLSAALAICNEVGIQHPVAACTDGAMARAVRDDHHSLANGLLTKSRHKSIKGSAGEPCHGHVPPHRCFSTASPAVPAGQHIVAARTLVISPNVLSRNLYRRICRRQVPLPP